MFLYIVFPHSSTQADSQSVKLLSACIALCMLVLMLLGQGVLHCTSGITTAQLLISFSFYVT